MDIAFPPSMIPAYDVHFDTLALPRLPVQPNDPKYSDYRPVSPYMYKHRPFVVARIPGTNIIDHIRLNETFSLYVYDFSFTTEAHMVIKGRGYNELEFLKKLMDVLENIYSQIESQCGLKLEYRKIMRDGVPCSGNEGSEHQQFYGVCLRLWVIGGHIDSHCIPKLHLSGVTRVDVRCKFSSILHLSFPDTSVHCPMGSATQAIGESEYIVLTRALNVVTMPSYNANEPRQQMTMISPALSAEKHCGYFLDVEGFRDRAIECIKQILAINGIQGNWYRRQQKETDVNSNWRQF